MRTTRASSLRARDHAVVTENDWTTLRRRHDHSCQEPTRRAAGHAQHHAISGEHPQAQGEPGQKQGRLYERMQLPGFHDQEYEGKDFVERADLLNRLLRNRMVGGVGAGG